MSEIKILGAISEVTGGKEHYVGAISLGARLSSTAELQVETSDVERAFELAKSSYVPATAGAPVRCVDGRTSEGYEDNDPQHYGEPLGPQIQGATIEEAVAKRLNAGYEPGATLQQDVQQLMQDESRFSPGSHYDSHSPLGCGAVKGQEAKLTYYQDPNIFAVISSSVVELAKQGGVELPADALSHLPDRAKELSKNAQAYYGDKVSAVDEVGKLVPSYQKKLIGSHNEIGVIVNFVPATTFHTNHFNALTAGKLQIFGLDAWHVSDPTLLADAVATLMNLTDGSLKLAVRLP